MKNLKRMNPHPKKYLKMTPPGQKEKRNRPAADPTSL